MNTDFIALRKVIGEKGLMADGDWIESKDQDPSGEVRLIQLADIGDGCFLNKSRRFLRLDKARELRCTFLEPGDILIARMPDPIARACIFPGVGRPAVTAVDVCILRPHLEVNRHWLVHAINSPMFRKQAIIRSGGATRSRISRGELEKSLVPKHSPSIQEDVASRILHWDHAIELTEKLLADKQALRRVLMHQLLTGKRRLPGFGQPSAKGRLPADWAFPKTEKVFKNVSIKNHPGEVVLSVTQDEGVVPRGDLDRKINMNHENTHTYKLVEVGDFVISLRSFQGGLEYSRYRGLVSPAYHVIRPTIALCDDYYRHYFKSPDFIQRLAIATIGIRDGKQISYGDFAFMKIPIPHLEEQRAIANVIDTCDREIELNQAKADALREQKRGLMQKLLTGKKRITDCAT